MLDNGFVRNRHVGHPLHVAERRLEWPGTVGVERHLGDSKP